MDDQRSVAFAVSVFALLAFACNKASESEGAQHVDTTGKVKCLGINECRGQAACDTATHSCAGQNECRGKGWIPVTKEECEKRGGREQT